MFQPFSVFLGTPSLSKFCNIDHVVIRLPECGEYVFTAESLGLVQNGDLSECLLLTIDWKISLESERTLFL
jgi:hypothetical protein